jgi:transporter family protein
VFLVLSGIATGISWLAYFRALQLGPASRVAPIDKLSLALTVVLAGVLLKEPVTPKVAAEQRSSWPARCYDPLNGRADMTSE